MTRVRLLLLWRVARALGGSKTGLALLGLYALVCGFLWLASHGWIAPDGTMDLRLWVNGHIVNIPKFQVAWPGGGVAALLCGFGLYGRAVAKGPILSILGALSPEAAEILASMEADTAAASEDRPEPIALRPAAGGLGATAPGAKGGGQ